MKNPNFDVVKQILCTNVYCDYKISNRNALNIYGVITDNVNVISKNIHFLNS